MTNDLPGIKTVDYQTVLDIYILHLMNVLSCLFHGSYCIGIEH